MSGYNEYSLSVGLSQLWTDEGNNRTRVRLYANVYAGSWYYTNYGTDAYVHIDVSAGNIEGTTNWTPWSIGRPTQTSLNGNYTTTTVWSGDYWFNHDANGYGAYRVYGSFESWGTYGTPTLPSDTGYTTSGLPNYDRKPAAPSSVTPVLNADRTITVTSNAVSSPASTAQYYIRWAQYTGQGFDGYGSWSAEEALGSNRFKTYPVNALAPGYTYKFSMRASNSDTTVNGGYSGYTESSGLFYPSSGKRTDGTTWSQMNIAKRFDGSSFVDLSIAQRYNGSDWVNLG